MPTIAQLEAELAQLQQPTAAPRSLGAARGSASAISRNYARQLALSNQIQALRQQAEADQETSAQRAAQARQDEILGGARGRLSELREDPVDQLLLDQLRRRVTGEDAPFDQATTNALFTERSGQAAAAEKAAADRLLARGMRPGDPAFEAAMAEIRAGTQAANQAARLAVDSTASRENYAARGGAIGQAGALNAGRNAAITDQSRYLGDTLARINDRVEVGGAAPGGAVAMPSFTQYRSLQSGGSKPAPAPAPTPAPRPSPGFVAPNQPGRTYNVGTGPIKAATPGWAQGQAPTQMPARPPSSGTITYRGQTFTPDLLPTKAPATAVAARTPTFGSRTARPVME